MHTTACVALKDKTSRRLRTFELHTFSRPDIMPRTMRLLGRLCEMTALPAFIARYNNSTSLAGVQIIEPNFDRFDLLGLPAEIRSYIFAYYFADIFASIDKVMANFADSIMTKKTDWSQTSSRRPVRRTPGLLLVCRQVYQESVRFICQQTLVFSHGLLDVQLRQLISRDTFDNVRHLVLTDVGHNVMHPEMRHLSFSGHRSLAFQLSQWLAWPSHKLESLELHFESPELASHVHCPPFSRCAMHGWIRDVVNQWRVVRDIPSVKIFGWLPTELKEKLIRLMSAPKSRLALLPDNVRNKIYGYLGAYGGVSKAINKKNLYFIIAIPTTPKILLLDSATTLQYQRWLSEQPLILDFAGARTHELTHMTDFITIEVLRKVRRLHVRMQHRSWLPLLAELAMILENAHSLTTFELDFKDNLTPRGHRLGQPYAPDFWVSHAVAPLARLASVRPIPEVLFVGDLLGCMDGLHRQMTGVDSLEG